MWKDIGSLKKENESLKEQAASALTKNVKLNEEVSALKDRIIKQEYYSRRENLRIRFYNISENQGETNEECVSKVKDAINSLCMNPNEINFHAIHRLGNRRDRPTSSSNTNSTAAGKEQSQRSCPRPILARFISRRDVDAVWERKKELLKSPHFSSVFIDKDLSAESAIIRGKLRAAYRKAKDLNITRVSIKGIKLFVNSDSYSADKLLDFLLPSKDNCNQNTSYFFYQFFFLFASITACLWISLESYIFFSAVNRGAFHDHSSKCNFSRAHANSLNTFKQVSPAIVFWKYHAFRHH